jgi:hypothetical protein
LSFEFLGATFEVQEFEILLLIVDLDHGLDMLPHVYAWGYDLRFLHWGVYSFIQRHLTHTLHSTLLWTVACNKERGRETTKGRRDKKEADNERGQKTEAEGRETREEVSASFDFAAVKMASGLAFREERERSHVM